MNLNPSTQARRTKALGWTGAGALFSFATHCLVIGPIILLWGVLGVGITGGINAFVLGTFAVGLVVLLVGLLLLWGTDAVLAAYGISQRKSAFLGALTVSIAWAGLAVSAMFGGGDLPLPAHLAYMVWTGFTAPIGVGLALTYIALRRADRASRPERMADQAGE